MIVGFVRDKMPRVRLDLPGVGGPISVEFIVDTGFQGELALPPALLARMQAVPAFQGRIRLADGSEREQSYFRMVLDWNEDARLTEVLVIDGVALLGVEMLAGNLVEM